MATKDIETYRLRYQRLIDQMTEALLIDDREGRVIFVNHAFRELFGLDEARVKTMTLEDYIAPDYHSVLRDRHERRVRGQSVPSTFEYVGLHADGTRLNLEVSVVPVIEDGQLTGTQSVIRNQTERRRMERELANSRRQMIDLLQSLPVAVTVLSPDAKVLEWNATAERMFGWTREEVIGQPYPLAGPRELEHSELLAASVNEGREWSGVETTRHHRDGSEIMTAIWSRPVRDEEGHIYASIGVLTDVSERRELERKVLKSEKMAALGLLAGGIAHDFNNLLTAMIGYPDLIHTELAADSPAHEHLDAIASAAVRASEMTGALLAFSRGRVAERVSLSLNDVIGAMRPILTRLLPDDVSLQLELDPRLPHVEADRSNIEQVLMNLVINARDAMPDGGSIHVSSQTVKGDKAAVSLTVTDTGTGMDAATVGQIFEPFFTTKSEASGTGLGLSTVYGIIEEHRGHIDVDSQLGRGTTICITLAATDVNPAPEIDPVEPATTSATTSLRLLLVDDDDIVRTVAKLSLESAGHDVTPAVNGAEALELLHQFEFDCIVSDILMPVMSGAELKQALVAEGNELPILWITGYSPEELRERFPEHLAGARVLTKPFTPNQLLLELHHVLGAV